VSVFDLHAFLVTFVLVLLLRFYSELLRIKITVISVVHGSIRDRSGQFSRRLSRGEHSNLTENIINNYTGDKQWIVR